MKTLLVLRHAKSSWKHANLSDHDRPLNRRGKRDAPRMGEFLRHNQMVPELIITSTAKRARTTAAEVALASGFGQEIIQTRQLYHAWIEDFIEIIRSVPDDFERIMIVGHNPGLEELLEALTGNWERMPTAALAQIVLPLDRWQDLDEEVEGRLVGLWRPKELPL